MTALSLTPAQRKAHRAQAHALNPVVMIGNEGLTAAVTKEIDRALSSHGLIKIRVLGDDREARIAMYESICDDLSAAPIQHIGKLLVVWRPVASKPEKKVPSKKVARAYKLHEPINAAMVRELALKKQSWPAAANQSAARLA